MKLKAVLCLIIQKVVPFSYTETKFLHFHPIFGLLLTGKVRQTFKLFLYPFSLTKNLIILFFSIPDFISNNKLTTYTIHSVFMEAVKTH